MVHRIHMEVFRAQKWREAGGDQPDGNEQFWEKATILHTYQEDDGDLLACVEWADGTTSSGHIVSMMREIPHGDRRSESATANRLLEE